MMDTILSSHAGFHRLSTQLKRRLFANGFQKPRIAYPLGDRRMKSYLHPASKGFLMTNQCPIIADVHRANGPDDEYVTFMEVENTDSRIQIHKEDWNEFQSLIAEIHREWVA